MLGTSNFRILKWPLKGCCYVSCLRCHSVAVALLTFDRPWLGLKKKTASIPRRLGKGNDCKEQPDIFLKNMMMYQWRLAKGCKHFGEHRQDSSCTMVRKMQGNEQGDKSDPLHDLQKQQIMKTCSYSGRISNVKLQDWKEKHLISLPRNDGPSKPHGRDSIK